jgi:hypothetical protein
MLRTGCKEFLLQLIVIILRVSQYHRIGYDGLEGIR